MRRKGVTPRERRPRRWYRATPPMRVCGVVGLVPARTHERSLCSGGHRRAHDRIGDQPQLREDAVLAADEQAGARARAAFGRRSARWLEHGSAANAIAGRDKRWHTNAATRVAEGRRLDHASRGHARAAAPFGRDRQARKPPQDVFEVSAASKSGPARSTGSFGLHCGSQVNRVAGRNAVRAAVGCPGYDNPVPTEASQERLSDHC